MAGEELSPISTETSPLLPSGAGPSQPHLPVQRFIFSLSEGNTQTVQGLTELLHLPKNNPYLFQEGAVLLPKFTVKGASGEEQGFVTIGSIDYFGTGMRVLDQRFTGGVLSTFIGAHPQTGAVVAEAAVCAPLLLNYLNYREIQEAEFNENPARLFQYLLEAYVHAQRKRKYADIWEKIQRKEVLTPEEKNQFNGDVKAEELIQALEEINSALANVCVEDTELKDKYGHLQIQCRLTDDDTYEPVICAVKAASQALPDNALSLTPSPKKTTLEIYIEDLQKKKTKRTILESCVLGFADIALFFYNLRFLLSLRWSEYFEKVHKPWLERKWKERSWVEKSYEMIWFLIHAAFKFTVLAFLFYWITWITGTVITVGTWVDWEGNLWFPLNVPGVIWLSTLFVFALPLAISFYIYARKLLNWINNACELPNFLKKYIAWMNKAYFDEREGFENVLLNIGIRFCKFFIFLTPVVLILIVIPVYLAQHLREKTKSDEEKANEKEIAEKSKEIAKALQKLCLSNNYQNIIDTLEADVQVKPSVEKINSEIPQKTSRPVPPLEEVKLPTKKDVLRQFWINFVYMTATLEFTLWFITASMAYVTWPNPELYKTTYANAYLVEGAKTLFGDIYSYMPLAIGFLICGFLYGVYTTWVDYQQKKATTEKLNAAAQENSTQENAALIDELETEVLQEQAEVETLEAKLKAADPKARTAVGLKELDILDARNVENLAKLKDPHPKPSPLANLFLIGGFATFITIAKFFIDSFFYGRMFTNPDEGIIGFTSKLVEKFAEWLGVDWFFILSISLYAFFHGMLKVGERAFNLRFDRVEQRRQLAPRQIQYLPQQLKALKLYKAKLEAMLDSHADHKKNETALDLHASYPDPEKWNATIKDRWWQRIIYAFAWIALAINLGLSALFFNPAASLLLFANTHVLWLMMGVVGVVCIIPLLVHLWHNRKHPAITHDQKIKQPFLVIGALISLLALIPIILGVSPFYVIAVPFLFAAGLLVLSLKEEKEGVVYVHAFLRHLKEQNKIPALLCLDNNAGYRIFDEDERDILEHALDAVLMAMNPNYPGQVLDVAHGEENHQLNVFKQLERIRIRIREGQPINKNDLDFTKEIFDQCSGKNKLLPTRLDVHQKITISTQSKKIIDACCFGFVFLLAIAGICLPAVFSISNGWQYAFSTLIPILFVVKILLGHTYFDATLKFDETKKPTWKRILFVSLTFILIASTIFGGFVAPYIFSLHAGFQIFLGISGLLLTLVFSKILLKVTDIHVQGDSAIARMLKSVSWFLSPRTLTKIVLVLALFGVLVGAALAFALSHWTVGLSVGLPLIFIALPFILKAISLVFEQHTQEADTPLMGYQKFENGLIHRFGHIGQLFSKASYMGTTIALTLGVLFAPVALTLMLLNVGSFATSPQIAIAATLCTLTAIFFVLKFVLPNLATSLIHQHAENKKLAVQAEARFHSDKSNNDPENIDKKKQALHQFYALLALPAFGGAGLVVVAVSKQALDIFFLPVLIGWCLCVLISSVWALYHLNQALKAAAAATSTEIDCDAESVKELSLAEISGLLYGKVSEKKPVQKGITIKDSEPEDSAEAQMKLMQLNEELLVLREKEARYAGSKKAVEKGDESEILGKKIDAIESEIIRLQGKNGMFVSVEEEMTQTAVKTPECGGREELDAAPPIQLSVSALRAIHDRKIAAEARAAGFNALGRFATYSATTSQWSSGLRRQVRA